MLKFISNTLEKRKQAKAALKQRLIEEQNAKEEAKRNAEQKRIQAQERAIIAQEERYGVKRIHEDVKGWIFTNEPRKPGYMYTYDNLLNPKGYPVPHSSSFCPSQCYKTIEEAFYYRVDHACVYLQEVTLKNDGVIWEQCKKWGGFYSGTKIKIHNCWRANIGVSWCQMNIVNIIVDKERYSSSDKSFDWKELRSFLNELENTEYHSVTNQQKKRWEISRDKFEKQAKSEWASYKAMRDKDPCKCLVWLLMQGLKMGNVHWNNETYDTQNHAFLNMNILEEMLRVSTANRLYNHPDPFYGMKFKYIAIQEKHCDTVTNHCEWDGVSGDVTRLRYKPIPHMYEGILSGSGPDTNWCNPISTKPKGCTTYHGYRNMLAADKDEYSRFVPFNEIIKYEERI